MFAGLDQPDTSLLAISLDAAVPLHVLDVSAWTPEQRVAFCHESGEILAHQGDVLQFGGKKGEAAKLFNRLAKALACLAFQPGGVKFCGRHWQFGQAAPDPVIKVPPPPPPRRKR